MVGMPPLKVVNKITGVMHMTLPSVTAPEPCRLHQIISQSTPKLRDPLATSRGF